MKNLVFLVVLVLAACGSWENTSDRAETVDSAVKLLQDLEAHGVWVSVVDGLQALHDQETGYEAVIQQQTVTIHLREDADGTILIETSEDAGYIIAGDAVYRVEGETATCATDDPQAPRSLSDLFGAVETQAYRSLAITEETEDTRIIAGRDATKYTMEPQLSAAADILTQVNNATLRQRVESAGDVEIEGELFLDDDTAALLRFHSVFTGQQPFTFEVMQWDGVDKLGADSLPPCP